MIKATELRIGNFVQNEYGILTVDSINESGINLTAGDGPAIYAHYELYQAEPIPLTAKWLVNFGFKVIPDAWDDMVFWSIGQRYSGFTLHETEQGYTNSNDKVIPYVHLLQNAYFFDQLDGSELTLKNQ